MAESKEVKESHRTQITIAVIGAAAVILAAMIGIIPSLLRDREATPAGGSRRGVPLPPEFGGNIRSVKANYGCGILLGATIEDQLPVCDPLPSVSAEWVNKIQGVDADCSTSTSDRIILELWTSGNYEGEYWAYTFGC